MENSLATVRQLHWNAKMLRKLILVAAATIAPTGSVMARGEVSLVNTISVPATPSSYVAEDSSYQWGLGVDLAIQSFSYQGQTLAYNPVIPARVEIVRVDNANANGTPCAIYAETAGAARRYQATLPGKPGACPLAEIISGNVANIGGLDVFTNAGPRVYSHKNIERVDLIYSRGIIAPTSGLTLAGHTVLEKSGNNPIQIAAILSLTDDGKPKAYGPLVKIHEAGYGNTDKLQYGITNVTTLNDFLSNNSRSPNGLMVARTSVPESLGFAFVSLADLGIGAGQKYFGISAFARDIDPTQHTLTAPETFPRDTGAHNDDDDADFHLGSGGNLQLAPLNQPPVARPDDVTSKTGEPVDIAPLSNDSDPENDPLQLEISRPPEHGTATIISDLVQYTSDSGFSGNDFLTYHISDGNGGSSEALIHITVTSAATTATPAPTAVLADTQSAKRVIETGLQGHGAGGFGWLLAPMALIGLRRHGRKTRSQQ